MSFVAVPPEEVPAFLAAIQEHRCCSCLTEPVQPEGLYCVKCDPPEHRLVRLIKCVAYGQWAWRPLCLCGWESGWRDPTRKAARRTFSEHVANVENQ